MYILFEKNIEKYSIVAVKCLCCKIRGKKKGLSLCQCESTTMSGCKRKIRKGKKKKIYIIRVGLEFIIIYSLGKQ